MKYLHCSAKIVSRSSGRSSVAAAAYRAGDKLINERDGVAHDYTRRGGVDHAEVLLPGGAPSEYADRGTLWNAVESIERQKNSQLAREVEIALPNELSKDERIAFARSYAQGNFVSKGMCADVAIHSGHNEIDPRLSNPHAHIMLTLRPVGPEGFGPKSKKAYMLDENGERIKTASGGWKTYKENSTNWGSKECLIEWRADLADRINGEMERLGIADRVDHRSYAAQGIDREATIHMGPAATHMEMRGEQTELGNINREIKERNLEREKLEAEMKLAQEAKAMEETAQQIAREAEKAQQQDIGPGQAASKKSLKDQIAEAKAMAQQRAQQRSEARRQAREAPAATEAIERQSAEALAGQLKDLAQQHEAIGGQLKDLREQLAYIQLEGRAAAGEAAGLERKAAAISELGSMIDHAKEDKSRLSFFAFRAKREARQKIEGLERDKDQIASSLGMAPSAALEMAGQLREQARQADERSAPLNAEAKSLSAKQAGIKKKYIEAAKEARAHPDREAIKAAYGDHKAGLSERLLEAEAEREIRRQERELDRDRGGWDRGGWDRGR